MDYFIFSNNDQQGPLDDAELNRRLAARELTAEDYLWSEGWEQWIRIGDWLAQRNGRNTDNPRETGASNPAEWRIEYRRNRKPPGLPKPSEDDRKHVRSMLPRVGVSAVIGYGCAIYFGAAFTILVLGGIVDALGGGKTANAVGSLVFLGIFVFAIVWIVQSHRNRFDRELARHLEQRHRTEVSNFENEEKSILMKCEQDTLTCRSIASHVAPKKLKHLQESLEKSSDLIGKAESLYEEGAFTPFWDSIDQAVGLLRSFDTNVGEVRDLSGRYYALLEGRRHNFPPFPVSRDSIPDPTRVFNRLEAVIAKAHRNFQFTQIYEQRKTTSAVVAGFSSLNHAISHLREDIVRSVEGLRMSVESGFDAIGSQLESLETSQKQNAEALRELLVEQHEELGNQMRQQHEERGDQMRQQHEELRKESRETGERDRRFQRESGESLGEIRKNTDRDV